MEKLDKLGSFLRNHKNDYDYFIKVCIRLTKKQLWARPAEGNSIANLLCHIAEMEGFWIDWGLCGNEFERKREIEFSRDNDLTPEEIIKRLEERCTKTQEAVRNVSDKQLKTFRPFHGSEMNGDGILMWHARHLGMHRGHITILERIGE